MIDITDNALIQLLLLAENANIPQDQVVFKIEAKMRQPAQLLWFITPDRSFDTRYTEQVVKGIRLAVENSGGIYIRDAVIDYDARLLKNNSLYAPTAINEGRPVWPKGFVFDNQVLDYLWT